MNIDIQHFKSLLEAEKTRIDKELKKITSKVGPGEGNIDAIQIETGEDTGDREDVAEAIETYEDNESVVVSLRTELNEINRALDKITAGTYGVCEINGEPIEQERLEADPAARTCKEHIGEL